MHKFIRLGVLLAVVALLLVAATSVFADPPTGGSAVCPVIGGPNNPDVYGTGAMVPNMTDNPAWGGVAPGDIAPGDVFWGSRPLTGHTESG